MKNIYKVALSLALALSCIPAFAQTGRIDNEFVETNKYVREVPNEPGFYTLTLETYVTGEIIEKITTSPCDIVMVLDRSTSMWDTYGDGTRAEALIDAVDVFVNAIYDSATIDPATGNPRKEDEIIDHKISIFAFEGTGNTTTADYHNDDQEGILAFITSNGSIADNTSPTTTNMSGNWVSITESGVKNLVATRMSSEYPSTKPSKSGTTSYKALCAAKAALDVASIKNDGHQKIVLFFTDGVCGYGQSWNNKNLPTGKAVINKAYEIKNSPDYSDKVKIFTVGIFENPKDNSKFYMNHVSSRFNKQVTQTSFSSSNPTFTSIVDGDKGDMDNVNSFMPNTPDDLKDVFSAIANSVSDDSESYELGSESTVVLDAMTEYFKLPARTEPKDISLFTCNAVTTNTDDEVVWTTNADGTEKWVSWTPWEDDGGGVIGNYIKIHHGTDDTSLVPVDTENDYLEVTGYDYGSHFVGPTKDSGGDITGWTGQKLIIQFKIQVDNANIGGLNNATNEAWSGVYGKNKQGQYEATEQYVQPRVNLPYLRIFKKGLNAGESAIFHVTKLTDDAASLDATHPFDATVIVTNDGSYDDSDWKLDKTPNTTIKLVYTGWYKVEELTSWTWASTPDATYKVDELETSTPDPDSTDVLADFIVFKFTNTAKENTADHAEAFKLNEMNVDGDIETGSSGEGTDPDDTI